ncbi:nucleoside transporter 4, putative [Hepatocystis sp. ex Piliocolobus tephrosceles]|nr:nucleoside transporter 4, putative [Hepatocystis sp. ex Piliocolobus tephrosceles]
MEIDINEKREKAKIRFTFFLLGIILSLPANSMVTVSFLINGIYQEELFHTIMGIFTAFMIISSFFQLTFESISFNSIVFCSIIKVIAFLFFLICVCVLNFFKYYLYIASSILGLLVGYLYSACTKYSILLNMNVNSHLLTGLCMSGFVFFFVNLFFSYFTIENGVVETYFSTIKLSFSCFIISDILFILYIIYVEFTSVYFKNAKKKVEGYQSNEKKNTDDDVNLCAIEHGDGGVQKCTNTNTIVNTVISKTMTDEAIADATSVDIKNCKNNNIHLNISKKKKKHIIYILKNKIINIKKKFNFSNLILGAKLIKYYYVCFIPITLTMFISYVIFPHLLPNMLEKTEYEKYFMTFLFQLSNVSFSMLMSSQMEKLNFVKQEYILFVSVLRILIIWLSYVIVKSNPTSFIHSNIFTSLIILLVGISNSIIRTISFTRIRNCFEDNSKKDQYISVSSSFCAFSYLVSYALAPWFIYIIKVM